MKASSSKKEQVDKYKLVTDKLIAALQKGTIPWKKMWKGYGFPRNYLSGHHYRGINRFVLSFLTPYTIPCYLTWSQIKELGGSIKKGSKAEWVYYYKCYYKNEYNQVLSKKRAFELQQQGAKIEEFRFLRSYQVFNVECLDNFEYEPLQSKRDVMVIPQCEDVIEKMTTKPNIVSINSNEAYYDPTQDIINVPEMHHFTCFEEY